MTRERGFTLLEMSITLLVVALLSTTIVEGLRFGMRTYAHVVEVDDASRELFLAQQVLRSALEVAYPFDPQRAEGRAFGLEGTVARLSFSASAARSNAPGALRRYEVFVVTEHGTRQQHLLLRWRFDRNGHALASTAPFQQEIIIGNIARVEWSYAVQCGSGELRWQQSWHGHRQLPGLIRLRVTFPKDDRRQWPELLVAPRITDDATSWLEPRATTASRCGVLQ